MNDDAYYEAFRNVRAVQDGYDLENSEMVELLEKAVKYYKQRILDEIDEDIEQIARARQQK